MNLNVNEIESWGDFTIGSLFDVDTGGDMDPTKQEIGDIPVICLGFENNGICMYIKETDKHTKYKGNSITCAGWAAGLKAFYQPNDFYVKGRVKICTPKFENNENISAFLCSIINMNSYLFSYVRKASGEKFLNIVLRLPIQRNKDGTPKIDTTHKYSTEGYVPNWQFMEDFIKTLHYKPITTKNKKGDEPKLDVSNWGDFKLSSICEIINGKGITEEEIENNPGELYAIQGGASNNGCLGKISKEYCIEQNYKVILEPCLTVARVGSAGHVNFQSLPVVIGDKSKAILLKEHKSNEIYLFLCTLLNLNKYKYSYGRGLIAEKYMSETLQLPIQRNEDGTPKIDTTHKYSTEGYIPDWHLMSNYIKSLPYGDRI